MVLSRKKKDQSQKHLQDCLAAALAAASLTKGIADDEINKIQLLIHNVAEKVERAPER
jgi:hypothetical protein